MERNRKSRNILFALTALLVASLACNLPGSGPPDEELPPPGVETIADWYAPPNSFPRRPDA